MLVAIKKWGNSQGLRIPREVLAQLDVDTGDTLDLSVRDGQLVLTPARRVRGGHRLRDLVRGMPKDGQTAELEWGRPVGREAW